jgi:hypothetical protein
VYCIVYLRLSRIGVLACSSRVYVYCVSQRDRLCEEKKLKKLAKKTWRARSAAYVMNDYEIYEEKTQRAREAKFWQTRRERQKKKRVGWTKLGPIALEKKEQERKAWDSTVRANHKKRDLKLAKEARDYVATLVDEEDEEEVPSRLLRMHAHSLHSY